MNVSIFLLAWLMSLGTPAPTGPVGPESAPLAAPVKVRLNISARDELKDAIRRHLVAEFQARGPVQWVENDPDWTLGVVTTELTDGKGATVAVGLSFIIERHGIHTKMLLALAQACRYFIATGLMKDAPLERDMQLLLCGVEVLPRPEGLAVVAQHKMCVITPDRVQQACHDVAALFDTERLGTTAKASSDADPSAGVNTPPPAMPVAAGAG